MINQLRTTRLTKTILLLAGSFTFAFLVGEMVHEGGHYLAHVFFGHKGFSIHLDPLGGSRILGVGPMPPGELGITTAAGPGLNLAAGILVTLLFLKSSHPACLPLILWGPVALIQEGVNASLGLLSHGSDAQWLVQWGIPGVALVLLGVLIVLVGIGLISWILHRSRILEGRKFAPRIILVFFSMGFLMILRALVASIRAPNTALGSWISLIFALVLAGLIAGTQRTWKIPEKKGASPTQPPSWADSILALGLGFGAFFFQIMLP